MRKCSLSPKDFWGLGPYFIAPQPGKSNIGQQPSKTKHRKRCPENITSVVKWVKLHFPKYRESKNKINKIKRVCFLVKRLRDFSHNCKKRFYFNFLITIGKGNLTHLTSDVMLSGQRFKQCFLVERLRDFFLLRDCAILFV